MPKKIGNAKLGDAPRLEKAPKGGASQTTVAKSALGQVEHARLVVAVQQAPKAGQPVVLKSGRLSDADTKQAVAKSLKTVSTDRNAALSFLRGIGVATATGRLTKRYGG